MRTAYLIAGWSSVGLGLIGAMLPVMPTTCFMIAALWFFSKSSPALALKLLNHPRFGAPLRAWVGDRAIPTEIKAVAVSSLVVSGVIVALTVQNIGVVAIVLSVLAGVAAYIVTRPSRALKQTEVVS
ncbi:MAG: YbaN family protein [Rhodospirillaceae bacterium]|nr:YbaN family protein [Rhodospirillaceae bacterium]